MKEACDVLGLPFRDEPVSDFRKAELSPADRAEDTNWELSRMPTPKTLARDRLWKTNLVSLQLEFVVYNKALADVADGTAAVCNPFYQAPLDRIRQRLFDLYKHTFAYKAGFLDPVDWRPRERNASADYVANHIMSNKCDLNTFDEEIAVGTLWTAVALQIFSDGGFAGGAAAAAVVFVAIQAVGTSFQNTCLGARGYYLDSCRSAFCAEVLALEHAVEVVSQLRVRLRPP